MDQFSHLSPSINDDTNLQRKIINIHPVDTILKVTMKDNLVTGNNHEINDNIDLINKPTEIIHNCIANNENIYSSDDIRSEEFALTTPTTSIEHLNNYNDGILLNTTNCNPESDLTKSSNSSIDIITNNSGIVDYVCIENYESLATEEVQTTANIDENLNHYEEEEHVENEQDIIEEEGQGDVEEEFQTNNDFIINSDAIANVENILQEQEKLPKTATDTKTKKRKRRRIVLLSDEENSEQSDQEEQNEKEREILLQDETHTNKILLNVNNTEYQLTDITDIPQQIFENEKPKPKSKKISTKIIKEFEARALIQSAVLIQAIDSKKKKIRVLDSDDDDDDADGDVVANLNENDLTDIGLVDPICTEDLSIANILMSEDIISGNFHLDELPMDKLPIESSIIETTMTTEAATIAANGVESDFGTDEEESEIYIPVIQDEEYEENFAGENMNPDDEQILIDEECDVDEALNDKPINVDETSELNMNGDNDLNNSLDLESEVNSDDEMKNEGGEDKVLELNDKDPFLDYSSSTSEEYLPNDLYFGTPDKLSISPHMHRGRPRGRPPLHQSQTRTCAQNNLENNRNKELSRSVSRGNTSRRGRPPLTNKISNKKMQLRNTSSSSDVTSDSISKSDSISSTDEERLRRRKKKSKIRRTHSNSHQSTDSVVRVTENCERKKVKKSRKHDRFYDRSRDIPNQIYFGDVQVPLHVLHSYGVTSESTSSSADSDTDYNSSLLSQNISGSKRSYNSCSSSRDSFVYNKPKSRSGRPSNCSVSPNGDDLIRTMRRYLKLAGIKGVKFNRLWEGCKSNQERADKILEVLHEHGLKGDATSTKCRELRKQIITKREIEDLDPNAIINSEGRSTRRSITRAATRRNYTYDDDIGAQQALKKLRNFVDSDSEVD